MNAKNTGDEEGAAQLRTLERGLRILSLFDVERPEWTFVEVCRESGLSKATAFRFLKKLETLNYLGYDERRHTYHLGSSLLRAAYLASSHAEIIRVARPHLERLARETGEAVSFALGTDQGPLIVDAVLGPNAFQPRLMVGVTLHGLVTAHSRIFAAYESESARLNALLAPHERRTENTVTDPQALAEMLESARRDGVSYSQEEWSVGACAAAAPVFDTSGYVLATIAIVAPRERFGPECKAKYGVAVKATAAQLTQELGGLPPKTLP